MKYMGSKAGISKHILPIILKDRSPEQWYYEPFMGGCNSLDKVSGKRVGNDVNHYLVELYKAVTNGYIPPIEISKDEYDTIRKNKEDYSVYSPELVGWVGFGCSYSGKWFGGYAGKTKTKIGTVRDYILESHKSILKQSKNLQGCIFTSGNYYDMQFESNSIVYCDPPYANTTQYKDKFDHNKFWSWCNEMVLDGHKVFVSEYSAPEDWVSVWEKEVSSSLSANGKVGGSKKSTEKLFTKLR